ncbi:hypothetical protein Ciccas_007160 [Cichlidogyrus casuarinus]|uniref:Uncharacterized protein n=1 Tax=Cichlidogyrus casuarinus TaxID=1844966 RepID=A0ABD2Q3M9_9PLAT
MLSKKYDKLPGINNVTGKYSKRSSPTSSLSHSSSTTSVKSSSYLEGNSSSGLKYGKGPSMTNSESLHLIHSSSYKNEEPYYTTRSFRDFGSKHTSSPSPCSIPSCESVSKCGYEPRQNYLTRSSSRIAKPAGIVKPRRLNLSSSSYCSDSSDLELERRQLSLPAFTNVNPNDEESNRDAHLREYLIQCIKASEYLDREEPAKSNRRSFSSNLRRSSPQNRFSNRSSRDSSNSYRSSSRSKELINLMHVLHQKPQPDDEVTPKPMSRKCHEAEYSVRSSAAEDCRSRIPNSRSSNSLSFSSAARGDDSDYYTASMLQNFSRNELENLLQTVCDVLIKRDSESEGESDSGEPVLSKKLPIGFQNFQRYLEDKFGPDHCSYTSSDSESSANEGNLQQDDETTPVYVRRHGKAGIDLPKKVTPIVTNRAKRQHFVKTTEENRLGSRTIPEPEHHPPEPPPYPSSSQQRTDPCNFFIYFLFVCPVFPANYQTNYRYGPTMVPTATTGGFTYYNYPPYCQHMPPNYHLVQAPFHHPHPPPIIQTPFVPARPYHMHHVTGPPVIPSPPVVMMCNSLSTTDLASYAVKSELDPILDGMQTRRAITPGVDTIFSSSFPSSECISTKSHEDASSTKFAHLQDPALANLLTTSVQKDLLVSNCHKCTNNSSLALFALG